jgi:hypothetical protein
VVLAQAHHTATGLVDHNELARGRNGRNEIGVAAKLNEGVDFHGLTFPNSSNVRPFSSEIGPALAMWAIPQMKSKGPV